MLFKVMILAGIHFFLITGIYAQHHPDYFFHHIGQVNGLLSDNIESIAQDGRGFVWIGTRNGLQRYDGARFLNYQDELNNGNKSAIEVHAYYRDADTQLFLVFKNQIKKLDLLTNSITICNEEDIFKSKSSTGQIYLDERNDLWAPGKYGVYYFNRRENKMSPYTYYEPGNSAKDRLHSQTWVTNGGGLVLFDSCTGKVYSYGYNPLGHPLLQLPELKLLKGVTIDSQNNLWIYSWSQKFYKYNILTKQLNSYSLDSIRNLRDEMKNVVVPSQINYIFEDNHHTIWLATANAGLLQYNRGTGMFTSFLSNNNQKSGLQYNYEILCIFQDRDDNIWLGTDKGINIFHPYRQYFQTIMHEPDNDKSIPKREITCFIETIQGDILVGTWGGGLSVFNKQLKFKKNILFSGASEKNLTWSFIQNDDGKIWIGCQRGYLNIYDPISGALTSVHPAEFHNSTIRCMQKDDLGNILFGLQSGKIAKWDKQENAFLAYNDSIKVISEPFSTVYNIFIDKANNCWAGTEKGLKQYNVQKRIFTAAYFPGKEKTGFCHGITEKNDNTLLVGLVNGGLVEFNKNNGTFSSLGMTDELSSVTINAVQRDAECSVWFTTDYNLYKFIPASNKYISYNTDPALINSSFQPDGFCLLKDGRWLASTSTEVICFYPDELNSQRTDILPVEITGMKIFDQPVFIDSFLFKKDPIKLGYKQNFLTIEFTALQFSGIKKIKYYYRLSGIDKNWVSASSLSSASYTNLSPGNYTFNVMAEGGNINGRVTSFNIIIEPPFWQAWWFRISLILFSAFLIFWQVRKRIAIIRREAALKQQVAETEMMALRAQMNPHFIFNCINSIDALIQSNDKYHATMYLNKFAKLIRNILDSSKQNTITLSKDLETLKLYIELEQFRNDNMFTYDIKADGFLLQEDYKIPPLIIQPYVENAILHGLRYRSDNKGRLHISVDRLNNDIVYYIEDNGVGRNTTDMSYQKEKQSYGIQMSNDRVKLFNNENKASVEITDLKDNGQPAGTRVRVLLKIQ